MPGCRHARDQDEARRQQNCADTLDEAQTSPLIVYRSLFDGFTPMGDAEQARHDFEKRARQSVLSLITDNIKDFPMAGLSLYPLPN